MPKKIILAVLFLIHAPPGLAEDDLWFDMGRHRYAVDLRLGDYSEGGYLQRLGLRSPLIGESDFSLAYTRVSGDEDIVIGNNRYQNNQSATRVAVTTDPLARWVFNAGYEAGDTELAEAYENWVAGLGYNYAHGYIEVSIIAGEDELELPVPRLVRDPVILKYQRDRVGAGLLASFYSGSWAIFGNYRDYTLSSDELTRTNEATVNWQAWRSVRERYAEQRRRRRLVGIESTTTSSGPSGTGFQQIGSIAERVWQVSIAKSIKAFSISAGYSGYEGFISGGAVNSYYLNGTAPINKHIDVSLLASVLEDSNAIYSELGAKFHW